MSSLLGNIPSFIAYYQYQEGEGEGGQSHNSAVGRLIEKRVSCRTNDWLK